jgi:hypothetical protein
MKKRYCPECGGEIIFLYETPTKGYRIEDDTLIRDDNNMTDDSQLNPYCSNDKEHRIQPYDLEEDREFWAWVDGVYMYFIDRGIYER